MRTTYSWLHIVISELVVILVTFCVLPQLTSITVHSSDTTNDITNQRPAKSQRGSNTNLAFSNEACVLTGSGGDGCTGCPPPSDPCNLMENDPCYCCSCIFGCIKPFIIAGNGSTGYSGDGSNAIFAQFNGVAAIAVRHSDSSAYVADANNFVIRKIDAGGIVTTIAGNPNGSSFSGEGGAATMTSLGYTSALAIDQRNGDLYAAVNLDRVVKIEAATGIIKSFAGGGAQSPIAGLAARDCRLGKPMALDVDPAGNLYIAVQSELGGGRYYKVNPSGTILLVAGRNERELKADEPNGDGGLATVARFGLLKDIAVNPNTGDVYVTDQSQQRVRRINNATGIVTTLLGSGKIPIDNGGPAADIALSYPPTGLAVDRNGRLYLGVASQPGAIHQVDVDGKVKLLAGGTRRYRSDNDPLTQEQLGMPAAIDIDSQGNLYIVDAQTHQMYKLLPKTPNNTSVITKARNQISPQNPPSNLTATLSGCCTVNLSWVDNSNDEIAFVLERSTAGGPFVLLAPNIPPNQTSFTDTNTAPNTSYCYRIGAIVINQIVSVEYEQLSGPLDNNPTANGGGKRIFPDADSVADQANRDVWITVKTSNPNTPIFLKSFDVDDSSNLFTTDDTVPGNDNLGPIVRGIIGDTVPGEGQLAQTTVTTTDDGTGKGIAQVKFTVTMQPGDNFRVVASTDQALFNNLSIQGQQIMDSRTGTPQPVPTSNSDVVSSPLLTVWRYVHLEVDSMPAPPNQIIVGQEVNNVLINIISIVPQVAGNMPVQFMYLDQSIRDGSYDLDSQVQLPPEELAKKLGRFHNGKTLISTTGQIIDILANGQQSVVTPASQLISCELIDKKGNKT
ncbi:MAG: hypothetical protein AB1489_40105, partial [Acidobacteriota bacterium]